MKLSRHLGKKAQTGAETMLVLAIGIAILLAFVSLTYNQIDATRKISSQASAQNAVNTLAKEINEAYFLGPGTIRQIQIDVPSSINRSKSFISNRSIILNIGETEAIASTSVDVNGTWPNSNGSTIFSIVSYEDRVLVSTQQIQFTPTKITQNIAIGSERTPQIKVQNVSALSKTYTLYVEGTFISNKGYAQVISANPLTINANSNQTITLSTSCGAYSMGEYSGKLILVPSQQNDFNLTLPVSLFCKSGERRLSIYPRDLNITAVHNTPFTATLSVCNTDSSDILGVESSVIGDLGSYAVVDYVGNVHANSCNPITISGTAPNWPGGQQVFGGINVSSSDNTNQNSIVLNIT